MFYYLQISSPTAKGGKKKLLKRFFLFLPVSHIGWVKFSNGISGKVNKKLCLSCWTFPPSLLFDSVLLFPSTTFLCSSFFSHSLCSPLFLPASANKLCMPSPTHRVLHCCTICSKLLLSLSLPHFTFCLSISPLSRPLSFSLLISHSLSRTQTQLQTPSPPTQPCTTTASIGRPGSSFPEFLAAQLHPGVFAPVLCQLP